MQYHFSATGIPELTGYNTDPYSIDVTSQNTSKQQCITATTSDPDPNPITNFHKGLLFCIQLNSGQYVALVEETQAKGSSNTLDLRETLWPVQSN